MIFYSHIKHTDNKQNLTLTPSHNFTFLLIFQKKIIHKKSALLHKPICKGFFQRYNFQMKKPTHKIYRTTNWPAYNRALMSRGNIAIWFDPATQWYAPAKGKQGRNQMNRTGFVGDFFI